MMRFEIIIIMYTLYAYNKMNIFRTRPPKGHSAYGQASVGSTGNSAASRDLERNDVSDIAPSDLRRSFIFDIRSLFLYQQEI